MGLKSKLGAGDAGLLSVSLMVWNEDSLPTLPLRLLPRILRGRGFPSSLLSACTRKKASTVGCSTSTEWGSFVSSSASRQSLNVLHNSSSSSWRLRDWSMYNFDASCSSVLLLSFWAELELLVCWSPSCSMDRSGSPAEEDWSGLAVEGGGGGPLMAGGGEGDRSGSPAKEEWSGPPAEGGGGGPLMAGGGEGDRSGSPAEEDWSGPPAEGGGGGMTTPGGWYMTGTTASSV